ncbi:hypothetical protein FK268_12715 [Tsukamurella sputi]|uniref:Uncharacterized protein n=1 Tax=Tsukamurella sputi TaxID=2591848 RepID=A0A5C5RQR0_9ACTN|nr:hypothetical protein [Tsukamurella sputi]TWS24445.1 hypothetical protein FK268_12715 [Tsukamurella sputi]
MPDLLEPGGTTIPEGLQPDPRLYPGPSGLWFLSIRNGRAHLTTRPAWFSVSMPILGPHAYAFDTARALEELRHART